MGRIRAGLLLATIGLAFDPAPAAAQAPPIWGDLEPGPYGVGLRVLFVADTSRTFGQRPWRPVRVLVWYPARPGSGEAPLRLGDLLRIDAPDTAFADYARAMRTRDSSTTARQFAEPADSLTDWITGLALAARRDAPAAPGRHPLVLHSLGLNDYQLESTVLWEYLASRGYVVAVVPQLGPAPDQAGLRLALDDLRLQHGDLSVARRAARALPFVNAGPVAIVGHSAGALAGLLLALEAPDVAGLVSLDGSIASPSGVPIVLDSGLPLADLRAPLLALYAVRDEHVRCDALNRLGNRQFRVGLGSGAPPTLATHFDFQNWPVFGELRGLEDPRGAAARPGALGAGFYRAAVRLTAAFLDLVVKGDREAEALLTGERRIGTLAPDLLRFSPSPAGARPHGPECG